MKRSPITPWRTFLSTCLLFACLFLSLPSSAQQQPDPELRALLKKTVNELNSFEDKFDAEVWLVDMSGRLKKRVKQADQRLKLLKLIHREAKRAGLSPELVISVIHVESYFNPYAISRVGAQGLMQVMPFWKKEIGRPDDNLTQIKTNLRYGCTILKHYLDREKGNMMLALARYNGSVGKTWYAEKVFNAWEKYYFINHQI